jgi:hypothetical protein
MKRLMRDIVDWARSKAGAIWQAVAPHAGPSVAGEAAADIVRSRRELVIENAMLRHQIVILRSGGAERIRGELLKLGIKVSKRTVQKYTRSVRERRGGGQTWATFIKNHADDIWCCDFVQT